MALPKVQETRELSDDELKAQILSVKKELFDLRFKQATRQ
ncbi:MAG: 50S ribosomal protein L29, partial [Pseudanabaena sp.]